MSERLLQPLADGAGAPTVTVDFGGGRHEAEFADLFRDLAIGGPVLELAPLSLVLGEGAPSTCGGYVDAYAEALAARQAPACLMGYCVAGALAHELAVRLAEAGRAPARVVLFDAAPVSPAEVVAAYEKVSRASAGEMAGTLQELAREMAATGASVHLQGVRAELAQQLGSECERMGVDPDSPLGEELIGRQTAWFAYVLAACSAPLSAYEGEVTLICSRRRVTPEDWPATTVRRHDVDVAQAELLSAPPVRALVAALLEEVPR